MKLEDIREKLSGYLGDSPEFAGRLLRFYENLVTVQGSVNGGIRPTYEQLSDNDKKRTSEGMIKYGKIVPVIDKQWLVDNDIADLKKEYHELKIMACNKTDSNNNPEHIAQSSSRADVGNDIARKHIGISKSDQSVISTLAYQIEEAYYGRIKPEALKKAFNDFRNIPFTETTNISTEKIVQQELKK